MSANFTTDLALKDEILPMDELFQYGDQKAGTSWSTSSGRRCTRTPR
jgi:hypothetical protein